MGEHQAQQATLRHLQSARNQVQNQLQITERSPQSPSVGNPQFQRRFVPQWRTKPVYGCVRLLLLRMAMRLPQCRLLLRDLPRSKVKNWLKTKFSRRMSKGQKSPGLEKENSAGSGFVGGAALTGASVNNSTASLGGKSSSVREVATAGTSSAAPASTTATEPTVDHYGLETLDKSPTHIESDPELEADSDTGSVVSSEHGTVTAPESSRISEPSKATEPTKVPAPETEERGRPVSKISTVSSMGREDDEE